MDRRVTGLIALTMAAAMLAPVAAGAGHGTAADCEGHIGGTYVNSHNPGDPQVPIITDGFILPITDERQGPFYLDVRELMSPYYIFSIWLYQETNGRDRLQRGGRSVLPDTPGTSGVEYCLESNTPDLAIF